MAPAKSAAVRTNPSRMDRIVFPLFRVAWLVKWGEPAARTGPLDAFRAKNQAAQAPPHKLRGRGPNGSNPLKSRRIQPRVDVVEQYRYGNVARRYVGRHLGI